MLLSMLLASSPPPSTDLLHDTAFQFVVLAFVTFLAGAIGGIISYWIFRKQRTHKEISYQIISDAPIASINKGVADRVEITFDGKPVKDLHLLVLKVWNSGNVAVKTEDYFEPIKFEFKGRIVLGCDVLDTEPEDLIDSQVIKTFLSQGQESIELPKFPFNSKESISIKILLTGAKSTCARRGRIANGAILNFEESIDKLSKRATQISLISIYILVILVVSLILVIILRLFNIITSIFIPGEIILLLMVIIAFFNARNLRRIRISRTKIIRKRS